MIRPWGRRALSRAGFTRLEIDLIDTATAPDGTPQDTDVTAKVWQAAMRSRRNYVSAMLLRGYTQDRITRFINDYYRRPNRSPFDFIKAEYRRPSKLTNYQRAVKLRAQQKIQRVMGNKYGTKR